MMLEKRYNPKKTEEKIYKLWERSGYFNPDKLPRPRKSPYTILLPPPNITGSLHMGHALNACIQDTIARRKRMEGFRVLWLPGTDHAGIATQNVVEKKLKKEGKTRFDLGRKAFEKEVWAWTKKYGGIILSQLKQLGASCDWSRKVFTLDKNYAWAVKKAFWEYWKKGWIYTSDRPVNWCPRCQTSLSDLELEYNEVPGKLWYIKYPLPAQTSKEVGSRFLVVATTRPETLLGDTALAVNPRDKRYKKFIAKRAIVPIVEREIPIVADDLVDPKFGTGVVKVTPAHDLKDYEIAQRHGLQIISVINQKTQIVSPAPKEYQGLTTLQAREKIIKTLKQKNLLESEKDYKISIPKCYRCNNTIEIIPSRQWFLKMKVLAQKAEQAVKSGRVKIRPKNFEKIYFQWLNNIRDWCLSRQIWWGHQLPVWECQKEKDKKKKWFVSLTSPRRCPICKKCRPRQVEDVLDTWFSSALWPFAALGWPKKTRDLKKFYPSDILFTGRDIINFWVTRMIFSGIEFMKSPPFPLVFIHPTILNKQGQRMSKSLGTGVDPLELIEKYGADAVRFGLLWQMTGVQDIRFDEQNIVAGQKFCNKIWNAARFVLQQTQKVRVKSTSIKQIERVKKVALKGPDKKILTELEKTSKKVKKDLDSLRFAQALQSLYHFFWHQFCDYYIEKAKIQIAQSSFQKEKEEKVKVLLLVLLNSLKLLHPFMPFVTEEIYQKLPLKDKKRCLMVERI